MAGVDSVDDDDDNDDVDVFFYLSHVRRPGNFLVFFGYFLFSIAVHPVLSQSSKMHD